MLRQFTRLLFSFMVVLLIGRHSVGQEPSRAQDQGQDHSVSKPSDHRSMDVLLLCDQELRLGMPERAVKERLGESCRIEAVEGSEGMWIVRYKKGGPNDIEGSLTFTAGRLASADRPWGSFRSEPTSEFGTDLFALIEKLQEQTGKRGEVEARDTFKNPGLRGREIIIAYDKRKVVIGVFEGREVGGTLITLNERLINE